MGIQPLTRALFNLSAACFFLLPLAHGEDVRGVKSCRAIADFLAGADALGNSAKARPRFGDLNCAAARRIPAETTLELDSTRWNPALQRWEFVLRCARREQCVPLLVWSRGENPQTRTVDSQVHPAQASSIAGASPPAVKTGQTALLSWDRAEFGLWCR
jgi:hypothetical protein